MERYILVIPLPPGRILVLLGLLFLLLRVVVIFIVIADCTEQLLLLLLLFHLLPELLRDEECAVFLLMGQLKQILRVVTRHWVRFVH